MIPRKRIDIRPSDLAAGAAFCFRGLDEARLEDRLRSVWPGEGRACPFLSVRSGFDATLQALALERGSEILVSALTIRDMARIILEHGLTPVPVDIDPARLDIDARSLEAAMSERTKAILVAHLFGSRMGMDPILEFARGHGLLVFEDCAQSFVGREYQGDSRSDVRMFSFGPIKTATALGGALFRFRDDALREKVRRVESAWPRQSRFAFFRRVMKYGLLVCAGSKAGCRLFVGLCQLAGTDQDAVLGKFVRGFAGKDFFSLIRRRPSLPLLALLARRIEGYRTAAIDERRRFGEGVMARLPGDCLLGEEAGHHTYWVFPILSQAPDELVRFLRSRGFDATRGQSSMAVVDAPGPASREPVQILEAYRRLVYLPVYPGLSDADIRLLLDSLEAFGGGRAEP